MSQIKLIPDPTFKAKVPFHVPGQADPTEVEFEFRHRGLRDFLKFAKDAEKMTDVEHVLAVCVGWELDEKFDRKNVDVLLDRYPGAARAIAERYVHELKPAIPDLARLELR